MMYLGCQSLICRKVNYGWQVRAICKYTVKSIQNLFYLVCHSWPIKLEDKNWLKISYIQSEPCPIQQRPTSGELWVGVYRWTWPGSPETHVTPRILTSPAVVSLFKHNYESNWSTFQWLFREALFTMPSVANNCSLKVLSYFPIIGLKFELNIQ